MTERADVYLVDSYVQELEAEVVDTTEEGIILNRCIFYPRGGGQPDDKGVIQVDDQQINVKGLGKQKGKVVLKIDQPIKVGTKVVQKIDWDYRYRLMKHHTALHVLSAVVWDRYEAKVTGGTIYHNKARLDFDLDAFSQDMAQDLVDETNRLLQQGHEVSISFVDREEAEADPDLIRTKINLLPRFIKEIRLVRIGDVDIQADGGLHVNNTSEVGEVELVKTENKGKGRKRISIAVKSP